MASTAGAEDARARAVDWWALALIVLCYGFYNLDKSLISVLIEPIKAEFRLSDSQMGLLTGLATSLPFAIACIPVGLLADRVNRRNLLAALVASWSAVTGLTSLAASTWTLFASRIGIGTFEAGFTPVSLSSLSDRFPLRMRATVMGIFNIGAAGGLFMGMAMGGFVEENHGWRTAFLVAGLPGIILAALLWLTTSEPARGLHDTGAAPEKPAGLGEAFAAMIRDRPLLHIAAGMTWGASMLAVFAVWTPSLLRRSFELGAADAGFYSGLIVGVSGAIGAATGGILADRISGNSIARKMLVPMAGAALSALTGLAALLGGTGFTATLCLLALSPFFGQFYIGTCYSVAATLAGAARRAVTLSILLVLFNLISYSLGSGLIGRISDHFAARQGAEALRLAYVCGYGFFMIALFHFWRAYAALEQREG